MKQQRVLFSKVPSWLKVFLGLALIALLLVATGSLLGSTVINPQTGSALQRLRQKSDIQQENPTPTDSTFYLPLVSQSDQTDSTTQWKEFSDPVYGFSIEYPSDWVVIDIAPANNTLRRILFQPENPNDTLSTPVPGAPMDFVTPAVITVRPDSLENVTRQIETYSLINVRKELITVNNIPGIRLDGEALSYDQHKEESTIQPSTVVLLPAGSNTLVLWFNPVFGLSNGQGVSAASYVDVIDSMIGSISIEPGN